MAKTREFVPLPSSQEGPILYQHPAVNPILKKALDLKERVARLHSDQGICFSCGKKAGGKYRSHEWNYRNWEDICGVCGELKSLCKLNSWTFEQVA